MRTSHILALLSMGRTFPACCPQDTSSTSSSTWDVLKADMRPSGEAVVAACPVFEDRTLCGQVELAQHPSTPFRPSRPVKRHQDTSIPWTLPRVVVPRWSAGLGEFVFALLWTPCVYRETNPLVHPSPGRKADESVLKSIYVLVCGAPVHCDTHPDWL